MSNNIYSYIGAIDYLIMVTLHESQEDTFPVMQAEIDCPMLSNNPRQAFESVEQVRFCMQFDFPQWGLVIHNSKLKVPSVCLVRLQAIADRYDALLSTIKINEKPIKMQICFIKQMHLKISFALWWTVDLGSTYLHREWIVDNLWRFQCRRILCNANVVWCFLREMRDDKCHSQIMMDHNQQNRHIYIKST